MNNNRQYKRQTREVPQEVRDKISASLKGVKKLLSIAGTSATD